MVGNNFQMYVFTFLENALNLDIFTRAPPSPQLKLSPGSIRKCEDDLEYCSVHILYDL